MLDRSKCTQRRLAVLNYELTPFEKPKTLSQLHSFFVWYPAGLRVIYMHAYAYKYARNKGNRKRVETVHMGACRFMSQPR